MAEKHLRRIEREARRLAEIQAELMRAIILARLSGETYEDIARSAGLTAERIRQIAPTEPQDSSDDGGGLDGAGRKARPQERS